MIDRWKGSAKYNWPPLEACISFLSLRLVHRQCTPLSRKRSMNPDIQYCGRYRTEALVEFHHRFLYQKCIQTASALHLSVPRSRLRNVYAHAIQRFLALKTGCSLVCTAFPNILRIDRLAFEYWPGCGALICVQAFFHDCDCVTTNDAVLTAHTTQPQNS